MEFHWQSFILEIINFLALVWILKLLFYKPILKAIEERKKNINQTLEKSEEKEQAALKLQQDYNIRLENWEKEKINLKDALLVEIEKDRKTHFEKLKIDLKAEKEKNRAQEKKELEETVLKLENQALDLSNKFASKFLVNFKGPELEKRIVELFLESLSTLSKDQVKEIKNKLLNEIPEIKIQSAYKLNNIYKGKIKVELEKLCGEIKNFEFIENQGLLSGLLININYLLLEANLRDELKFFSTIGNGVATK